MVPTRTSCVIFGLVVLVIQATTTNAAARTSSLPDHNKLTHEQQHSKRHTLPHQFRSFLFHLASLFNPGSLPYKLLKQQSDTPPPPRALARTGTRDVVVHEIQPGPSRTTCYPPCRRGRECCLLRPGSSVASCQRTRMSGYSCGWNHYTGSNPSTTQAMSQRTCPCMVGMACVSATSTRNGICTFF